MKIWTNKQITLKIIGKTKKCLLLFPFLIYLSTSFSLIHKKNKTQAINISKKYNGDISKVIF